MLGAPTIDTGYERAYREGRETMVWSDDLWPTREMHIEGMRKPIPGNRASLREYNRVRNWLLKAPQFILNKIIEWRGMAKVRAKVRAMFYKATTAQRSRIQTRGVRKFLSPLQMPWERSISGPSPVRTQMDDRMRPIGYRGEYEYPITAYRGEESGGEWYFNPHV